MSIAKWTNRQTNRFTDKLINRTSRCDIAEFGNNFELFFMSYTDDWEVNNPDQIKRLLLRFHKNRFKIYVFDIQKVTQWLFTSKTFWTWCSIILVQAFCHFSWYWSTIGFELPTFNKDSDFLLFSQIITH